MNEEGLIFDSWKQEIGGVRELNFALRTWGPGQTLVKVGIQGFLSEREIR